MLRRDTLKMRGKGCVKVEGSESGEKGWAITLT